MTEIVENAAFICVGVFLRGGKLSRKPANRKNEPRQEMAEPESAISIGTHGVEFTITG